MIRIAIYFIAGFSFFSCKKNIAQRNTTTVSSADTAVYITTDKAAYLPGESVMFSIDRDLPNSARIRYRQLSTVIAETNFEGKQWKWIPPGTDFTGYMVDVYNIEKGAEKIYGSIAVDVSSDWSRFIRYGFLSAFGPLLNAHMDSVMNMLNRLHINGLQFYDWSYEHHQPLAGTVSNPASSWKDIASRENYKSTVDHYISVAHEHNMKAMSYNLCYGALNDAAQDGVLDQWYMYTDQNHQKKTVLTLPAPFKSNIFLMAPSNANSQKYIAARNLDMSNVFAFDGYHVDPVAIGRAHV